MRHHQRQHQHEIDQPSSVVAEAHKAEGGRNDQQHGYEHRRGGDDDAVQGWRGPGFAGEVLRRITSYNVCYTKLLRGLVKYAVPLTSVISSTLLPFLSRVAISTI